MLNRSHQRISIKYRILIQKYDDLLILFDNVIAVQMIHDHFANETWVALNHFQVSILIEWLAIIHGRSSSIVDQGPHHLSFERGDERMGIPQVEDKDRKVIFHA